MMRVVLAQAFVDFNIVSFLTDGFRQFADRVEGVLRDEETLRYLLVAVAVMLVWRLITRIRWSRPSR